MSHVSSPLTNARTLRTLTDNGTSITKAAAIVGCSRPMAYQLLSLLELAPTVQQLIEEGMLDVSSARLLPKLSDGRTQLKIANRIIHEQLSSRQADQLIKQVLSQPLALPPVPTTESVDPDVSALCERLTQCLGSPVNIVDYNGNGTLTVRFSNPEILAGVIEKIAIPGLTYSITFDTENVHAGVLALPYRSYRELDAYLAQAGVESEN